MNGSGAAIETTVTAASLGLIRCESCGGIAAASAEGQGCPVCGAKLHLRKRDSVAWTWAWLVAALAMYAPANMLPIMQTATVTQNGAYTIFGGVEALWASGSWDLAAIVFVASIVVPLGKILALAFLAFTTQRGSSWRQEERTRLYRLVEIVGRWAMLDIFVVVLLVGFVQFNSLATISPEPGALAFAAVVVLTILASMSFDPRLIWDGADAS